MIYHGKKLNYKTRINLADKRIKANKIIDLVSDYLGVNARERNRIDSVAMARQLSVYFIRKNIQITYREIGLLFLTKRGTPLTHDTIIHARKKIEGLIEFDKEVIKWVNDLKDEAKAISELSKEELFKYKKIEEIKNKLFNIPSDDFIDTIDLINNNIEHYTNG